MQARTTQVSHTILCNGYAFNLLFCGVEFTDFICEITITIFDIHLYCLWVCISFRSEMAEAQPSHSMGGSLQCYTCRLHGRESFQGEVWYDKVQRWSCLLCHLAEKNLQYSSKWKGIVKRIFRACDGCGADLSSEQDSTPRWYCYDCRQFLCDNCVSPDRHNDEKSRVSCYDILTWSCTKTSFTHSIVRSFIPSFVCALARSFASKLFIACGFHQSPMMDLSSLITLDFL